MKDDKVRDDKELLNMLGPKTKQSRPPKKPKAAFVT